MSDKKMKIHKKAKSNVFLIHSFDLIPSRDDKGEYTEEFKASLLRSPADIKNSRVHTLSGVRKNFETFWNDKHVDWQI